LRRFFRSDLARRLGLADRRFRATQATP
jgi:hypothetical protein